MKLEKVDTKDNLADLGTKLLNLILFLLLLLVPIYWMSAEKVQLQM